MPAFNISRVFIFAVLGAVVATFCDNVHVLTGTLSYPNPVLYGQAWWVFPGFTAAFLLITSVFILLMKRLPRSIDRSYSMTHGTAEEFVDSIILFALVYLMSGFGSKHSGLLSAIFYVSYLMRITVTRDRVFMIILSVLMAIGGMFAEGAMSALGLVTYANPEVFHVPVWLGGLYLHGAFAVRNGYRFLLVPTGGSLAPTTPSRGPASANSV